MKNILICIAVFDTIENKRTEYTIQTYESLVKNINSKTTKVVFIDNDSCKKTKDFLAKVCINDTFNLITSKTNLGTAEGINLGIHQYSKKGDYIIKMDNDIVVYQYGWPDILARCIQKDNNIGILGLKRKDLDNQTDSKDYPTFLKSLPHIKGEHWDNIEVCEDIIGSCTMYNPLLLEKVGYLWQIGVYAFDDVFMSARSLVAGFYNAFYPSIEIDNLDDGKNPYTQWKQRYAGMYLSKIKGIIDDYQFCRRSIYYNPFE
jgi:GT2 family glycosyltransferase